MADITFSDKAGSSNFTAGGDKRNQIFADLLLNRAELETYLTSLRRQQYSASPPANPNTGDMWRCSTTGATYTAGVLYRYSGTAWAQEIATALNVPNRNTVLQGAVNSSGVPTLFEAGTGLAVKLNATATPAIFAFMNGNSASTGAQDIIDGIAADSATFWSSLPINSTVSLFIDRSSTGVLSGSYTTIAPVTQNYAPAHSAGLQWIDFNTGKVQSSDGSVWTQRNRVFVGTATTDGTGVTAVNVYPYNQTHGVNIFDDIITKGPWVDVRAFGAVGDGVTDDTVAIQATIDYLHSLGGGVLLIPSGDYVISHIDLCSDITLQGMGISRLKQKYGTTPRYPHGDGIVCCNLVDADSTTDVADNKKNICLFDLTLEGNSVESGFYETMGIVGMQAVSNVLIERCKFIAPQGDGVAFYSGMLDATEKHCQNLTIRDCQFDGVNYCNRQGISFYDVDGALVEGCTFTRLVRDGMPGAIDFEGRDRDYVILRNITVRNNIFKDIGVNGGACGVIAYFWRGDSLAVPAQNFNIENNKFENCTPFSISVAANVGITNTTPSHNVNIIGNACRNFSQGYIAHMNGVVIEKNTFDGSDSAALYLGTTFNSGDMFTIRDNTFANVGKTDGNAIKIGGIKTVLIDNNRFINPGKTDGSGGNCINPFYAAATLGKYKISNNKLISSNSFTKYFLNCETSITADVVILEDNDIYLSGTGAAILGNDQDRYTTSKNIMSAYSSAFTLAKVLTNFPVGVTHFMATAGQPGTATEGTVVNVRATGLCGYQYFIPGNNELNRVYIRHAITSGTAWSAWEATAPLANPRFTGTMGVAVGDPKATLHGTGTSILGVGYSDSAYSGCGNNECNPFIDGVGTLLRFNVKDGAGLWKTAAFVLSSR